MRRFFWIFLHASISLPLLGCATFPQVLATPALAVAEGVQGYAAASLEKALADLPPQSGALAGWLTDTGGLSPEEAAFVEDRLGPDAGKLYLGALPRYVRDGALVRSVDAALTAKDGGSFGAGELARFLLALASSSPAP